MTPSKRQRSTMVRRIKRCRSTARHERMLISASLLVGTSLAFVMHNPLQSVGQGMVQGNTRAFGAMQSSHNDADYMLQSIMDQAVLLYSSSMITSISDSEIQQDIHDLRQRELASLVEDTAAALNKQRESDARQSSAIIRSRQFSSIQEVGKVFDEAIMNAVVNNKFDNEDIVALATEHYRLQKETSTVTSEITNELQTRLDQLRVLIAPEPSHSRSVITAATEQLQPEQKDEELLDSARPVRTKPGVKGARTKATKQQPEEDKEKASVTDTVVAVAAVQVVPDEIKTILETESTAKLNEKDGEVVTGNRETSSSGADALAAVISIGAVAAALVTKLPIVAAGAAFGPVLFTTVSTMQNNMMKTPLFQGRGTATSAQGSDSSETK